MKKILIVDDDEIIRNMLLMQLKRLKKEYQIITAADGFLAIEALKETPVDLVLIDFNMPRMDGMKAFIEIKKLYPELPVIMMSGSVKQELSSAFLYAGGASFIQKPFCPDELNLMVESILKENNGVYSGDEVYELIPEFTQVSEITGSP